MANFTNTGGNSFMAVKDLESAIKFYQEVLGVLLVKETNGKAYMKSEGSIYEADLILLQTEPFQATGIIDEKWNVTYYNGISTNVEATYQKLLDYGVQVTEMIDEGVVKRFVFSDPFGNRIGIGEETSESPYYEQLMKLNENSQFHNISGGYFIPTNDLNLSLKFYTEIMGMELVSFWGEGADLKNPQSIKPVEITLLKTNHYTPSGILLDPNIPYINFNYPDLKDVIQRLSAYNITVKSTNDQGCYLICDPNGHSIGLIQSAN